MVEREVSTDVAAGHSAATEPGHRSQYSMAPETPEQTAVNVHRENLAKMAAMSEEEILAEQKKLLEVLGEHVLFFFGVKAQ